MGIKLKQVLDNIKSYKHKIRGKNRRNNPCKFSQEKNKQINAALKNLLKNIKQLFMHYEDPEISDDKQYSDYHLDGNGKSLEEPSN